MNKNIDTEFLLSDDDWERIIYIPPGPEGDSYRSRAEVLFSRFLERSSNSPDIYRSWGALAFRNGEYSKSAAKYKKALELEPDSQSNLESLGECLYRLKRYEEALCYFWKAFELGAGTFSLNLPILKTLKSLNRLSEFEPRYEGLFKLYPHLKDRPYFFESRAEAFVELKEYSHACKDYKRAIELMPNNSYFHSKYSIALYHEGDFSKALEHFEKILVIDPESHQYAYNQIAFVKYHLGQIEEAIKILKSMIRNKLEDFTTNAYMVLFQYHLHQNEDIIKPYLQKFKYPPDWNRYNLNQILKEDKEHTEQILEKTLDKAKKDFYSKKLSGINLLFSLFEKD